MRTSFLHLADVGLGYGLEAEPESFQRIAAQFRFAVDHALDQRVSFVLFSGNLFDRPDVPPAAFQVALANLRLLAEKNVPAVAVQGRADLAAAGLGWYGVLAQEGLLAVLEPQPEETRQLRLRRWERRDGGGSYVDLTRCRVFGAHYYGALSPRVLDAFSEATRGLDNSEMDFRVLLLNATVDPFSQSEAASLSFSDLQFTRRQFDYVALGGTSTRYEAEHWAYNPGSDGFYYVMVDTAVEPKHQARFVEYPANLAVSRPARARRREARRQTIESLCDQLAIAGSSDAVQQALRRDVLRLAASMLELHEESDLRHRVLDLSAAHPTGVHAP
ncbi:MAG: hypothetical protein JOZ39_06170 [Chloroflexi bacterium]|nr:hypothetical protein [Chloroflexota bacterium]